MVIILKGPLSRSKLNVMITEEVIKEIYKNYKKPPQDVEELNIPYFIELLKPFHNLKETPLEIVVDDDSEFDPFKHFLKRALIAVLEFDKNVAFVFKTHIVFFSKYDDKVSIHFKPVEEKSGGNSWLSRLFGKDE